MPSRLKPHQAATIFDARLEQDHQQHMSLKHFIQIESAVVPNPGLELLRVLEAVWPVKFLENQDGPTLCPGRLAFGNVSGGGQSKGSAEKVRLTLPKPKHSVASEVLVDCKVRFADDAAVPFPFRGRLVECKAAPREGVLTCGGDEKILASCDDGAVWVVSTGGGSKHYRSAFHLPDFPEDRILQDVCNGNRFMEMLPVLHFLREAGGEQSLEGPPLRAGFIFDDPNLHWPRYGLVDFYEIATHAEKENYHVSFATIPLDAWFTHGATAELFRNHSARMSLCVHGNNHVREELARNYTRAGRIALLRQAIARMEKLERRTGLKVCRVMVPPHGACKEEMLAELPGCGFESACISHGSLRAYNAGKPWTRSLGLAPSETVLGCPVLPRWAVIGKIENTILLAAFLRQPMILRGHHQDLRDGIEVLDRAAQFINSLGPVSWSNLTGLSRGNYQWRREGDAYHLKPLGRKVAFQKPDGAARLVVASPHHESWTNWQVSDGAGRGQIKPNESVVLNHAKGDLILVETNSPDAPPGNADSEQSTVPAFFRRLLTEGRDRFLSR